MQKFSRPPDQQPTRHLFVGNVHGADEGAVRAVFAPFGIVEEVYIPAVGSPPSYVFVTYAAADEGQAALAALAAQRCPQLGSSSLQLKFTVRKAPKQVCTALL
jgi:hypothetical protein